MKDKIAEMFVDIARVTRSCMILPISILVVVVMILGGVTTACLPVYDNNKPIEEDSNVQKDLSSQSDDKETAFEDSTIYTYLSPDRWQEEYHSEDGKTDVFVDATPYLPTDTWGIYELIPEEITDGYFDTIIKTLIGNSVEVSSINDVSLIALGKKVPARLEIDQDRGKVRFKNTGGDDGLTGKAIIYEGKEFFKLTITQEDAAQIARNLVNDMGFDYLDIAQVHSSAIYDRSRMEGDKMPEFYSFSFTRTIGGIPIDFAYWTGGLSDEGWNQYSLTTPEWPVAEVTVGVDDSGVVLVDIDAKKSEIEMLTEGVKLMDFEEIINVFKEKILSNAYCSPCGYEGNVLNRELHVDEIKLSYRVSFGDDYEGQMILMPVWDFYGYEITSFDKDYPEQGDMYAALDENYQMNYDLGHKSILTMSALDGTILYRSHADESTTPDRMR
ncbi:MAG: hypothetical protein KAQ68_01935 [Clostridiales bacterium]|nr:hypothetical protein [Clostridiales bacterium]